MLPFHKILCPTDFSELSGSAMDAAVEIAKCFAADLYLVHVVHPTLPVTADVNGAAPVIVSTHDLQEILSREAEQKLRALAAHRVPADIPTHFVVRRGDTTLEILRAAEKEGADLIVMATRGTIGWQHTLQGSVTEEEVRLAPCPVLTLHDTPATQPANEVSKAKMKSQDTFLFTA